MRDDVISGRQRDDLPLDRDVVGADLVRGCTSFRFRCDVIGAEGGG